MRPDRLRGSVNTTEVGVDFALPRRFRKLGDTAEDRHAGIVDENIDVAARRHRIFNQPGDVAAVGDVGLNRKRRTALPADLVGDRSVRRAIEIGADDHRAFLGKAYRGLAANARGRFRHDHVLSSRVRDQPAAKAV